MWNGLEEIPPAFWTFLDWLEAWWLVRLMDAKTHATKSGSSVRGRAVHDDTIRIHVRRIVAVVDRTIQECGWYHDVLVFMSGLSIQISAARSGVFQPSPAVDESALALQQALLQAE